MVAKIGHSEVVRIIQALEKRGLRNDENAGDNSDDGSIESASGDRVDTRRDGDLDPETLQIIDHILAGEEE